MVLKLPWAEKRMFWAFEESIFQFFADFWVTKLKPFSRKERKSVQDYLNQNLVLGSLLENGFEATLSSKRNVVSVWKGYFSVFCRFLSDKVETILWESEAKHSKLLNQNLVIGSFFENDFEATLSSKTNVVSIWKEHFSVFCKSLSNEVETIFWESKAKRSKLFKSKFGHRKLLRKWFWGYVELKSECCECLKRAFFSFLKIFEWRSWNRLKNFFDKVYFVESILESASQSLLDHSRQSLLEILNISNVFDVAIWIFSWS